LTDAALLEVVTAETPLVTVDLDLYLAALAKGQDTVVNFTHLQNLQSDVCLKHKRHRITAAYWCTVETAEVG